LHSLKSTPPEFNIREVSCFSNVPIRYYNKRWLLRQQDRIDHVDHAVGCFDVGDDHLHCIIQIHIAVFDGDLYLLAFQGGVNHLSI